MEEQNKRFINSIKKLLKFRYVNPTGLKFKIYNFEEVEFNEYCLILNLGNYLYKGIYLKTEKNLKIGKTINNIILYLKIGEEIKLFMEFSNILQLDEEEEEEDEEDEKEFENSKKINEDDNFDNTTYIEYNFNPENIIDFFKKPNDVYHENIFMVSKIDDKMTNLISIKDSSNYLIDNKNNFSSLNLYDKIYIKNYMLKENNEILCNKLTTIKYNSDYDIFHTLETKIKEDFYEINKIENNNEIFIKCLICKVIEVDKFKDKIKIIDELNRIIQIDKDLFNNLDLFDLLLITNCKIKKSKDDEYSYDLKLTENSIKYHSKNLFFDKRISLNNYTILDINIPDFKKENNIFNTIIISKNELEINKERHIFLFKFENEQFNEMVPFSLKLKNNMKEDEYKFFIMNNILNKANISINSDNKDKCCMDCCYINRFKKVKNSINIIIGDKEYNIKHYNSFNSLNRIGFILINIPMNESVKKIKNATNKNIISSQIWFTQNEKSLIDDYSIVQILDVDEAQKKTYKKYNLKDKDYLLFKNVYETFVKFEKNWDNNAILINNYFNNLTTDYIIINKVNNLINNEYNTDYDPNSADYSTLKLYINISLYAALKKIKEKQNENFMENWYNFLKYYIKLINFLRDIKDNLTYHQKIRIINCFCLCNSDIFDKIKRPCRLFYLEDDLIENNSYKFAMNFNKKIIQNLEEKSALTSAFLQLDSFILKNYLIDKFTYSLTIEPLILMKKHLLLNYENFLFINYEESDTILDIKAFQNSKNKITIINEKSLFNCGYSESLTGKDNALPISMEFFHEKDFHSKKSLKNLHIISPISCFKFNRNEILNVEEDGKFLESIIGDNDFILQLKNPINNLGELMEVEYFISENFDKLKNEFNELNNLAKEKYKKIYNSQNEADSNEQKKSQIKVKKTNSLKTLKDFEDTYLCNGKFVYPDSLPFHSYNYGEKLEISDAEQEYLDKYKDAIEKGKKMHLMD